jgi:predicted dehydrogenase
MPLKVALVGCGKIASGHIEEIQKMPEKATVVAVCDRELLMAEQTAVRYGIRSFYDSYEGMIAAVRPHVIHITTPPESHLELTRVAVDAGCHVYVEKPLTLTYPDAQALVAYVERARKLLTIGYTYLFDPPALEMRRLIGDGVLGEVVHVESFFGYSLGGQFGAAIRGDPGHWVHALPGKLFQNNIDHLLNKLTEFVDDDEPSLVARAWRRDREVYGDVRDDLQDELRVTLIGKRVSAYATFSAHVKPAAHFVRVYGEKNIVHVDYIARTLTLEPGPTLPSVIGRVIPPFGQAVQLLRAGGRNACALARGSFQFFSGMNRLMASFYDAIANGGPPPIPTRDILRVALWLDRIWSQIGSRR